MPFRAAARCSLAAWLAAGCSDPLADPAVAPVALTGLVVLDGTSGPPRSAHTIVLQNGIITHIGPDGAIVLPEGIEVLDLRGKWALSPAAVPATGVELRRKLERGELLGPRFLTAGRLIDGPDSPWGFAAEVTTEAEIRAEVARQAAEGVDFVKLYSQLSPALVAAGIQEALDQLATRLTGRRVAVDPNLVLAEAMTWGDDPEAFARLETHHDVIPHSFPHPYSARWSPTQRAEARMAFPRFLEAIRLFQERGVLLTVGTDLQNPWMTPGVSYHRELALLVGAGIPPTDVILIATRNGAESLGILDQTGTLEAGKAADLMILDRDPLADIANTRSIHLVIRRGQRLRPPDLLAR